MKIRIINQQKIKRVSLKRLRKYLKKVSGLLNISSKRISILLCDNKLIKKLNKKYLKRNSSTDVIAFPLSDRLEPDYLGEVVVSTEKAAQVALKLGLRWQDELVLYVVHGILHLLGYDDRTKKKRKILEKKQKNIIGQLELKSLKIKL